MVKWWVKKIKVVRQAVRREDEIERKGKRLKCSSNDQYNVLLNSV